MINAEQPRPTLNRLDLVNLILQLSWAEKPELRNFEVFPEEDQVRIVATALDEMKLAESIATAPGEAVVLDAETAEKMRVIFVVSGNGHSKSQELVTENKGYIGDLLHKGSNMIRLYKALQWAEETACKNAGVDKNTLTEQELYRIVQEHGPILFFNGVVDQCADLLAICKEYAETRAGVFAFPPSKLRFPSGMGEGIKRTSDQVKPEQFLTPDLVELLGTDGILGVVSHSIHTPRVLRMLAAQGHADQGYSIKALPVHVRELWMERFAVGEAKGILAYTLIDLICGLLSPKFT